MLKTFALAGAAAMLVIGSIAVAQPAASSNPNDANSGAYNNNTPNTMNSATDNGANTGATTSPSATSAGQYGSNSAYTSGERG